MRTVWSLAIAGGVALALVGGRVVIGCGGGEPRAHTPQPAEIPMPSTPASESSAAPTTDAP